MIYWYLLNYKIYKFYESRGEMFSDLYSWMGSTVLLNLNVYPFIHVWIKHNNYVNLYGSRMTSIIQILPFLLITYFILYYKNRYVDIFREMDNNRQKYEKKLLFINYYIIVSIIVFISLAVFT
jgi:hypothetical protein